MIFDVSIVIVLVFFIDKVFLYSDMYFLGIMLT